MNTGKPIDAEGQSRESSRDPGSGQLANKFRKKPVVIEAERFDDGFFAKYFGTKHHTGFDFQGNHLLIETLEGAMRAERGDWIITGIKGERYPCKPDIFAATYEPASAQPTAPEATAPPLREEVPLSIDHIYKHLNPEEFGPLSPDGPTVGLKSIVPSDPVERYLFLLDPSRESIEGERIPMVNMAMAVALLTIAKELRTHRESVTVFSDYPWDHIVASRRIQHDFEPSKSAPNICLHCGWYEKTTFGPDDQPIHGAKA